MDWNVANQHKVAVVHPLLRVRVMTFLVAMGAPILITQALRTWAEQAALYAKGRTSDEIANHVRKHGHGGAITDAPPGYSSHNFGLAVDLCPDDPTLAGLQLDWNVNHPLWQQLLSMAPLYGLAEGAQFRSFPDNPHFYLKELNDTPTDAMRAILANGGTLQQVWDSIASQLPTEPVLDPTGEISV